MGGLPALSLKKTEFCKNRERAGTLLLIFHKHLEIPTSALIKSKTSLFGSAHGSFILHYQPKTTRGTLLFYISLCTYLFQIISNISKNFEKDNMKYPWAECLFCLWKADVLQNRDRAGILLLVFHKTPKYSNKALTQERNFSLW